MKTLFKKSKQKTVAEIKNFVRHLNIPKLPEDKSKLKHFGILRFL